MENIVLFVQLKAIKKNEKMAKNKSTVYLGYEDEEVTAKQAAFLNSCTNKIGGTPVSRSAEP